jgi:hypothetical protein
MSTSAATEKENATSHIVNHNESAIANLDMAPSAQTREDA